MFCYNSFLYSCWFTMATAYLTSSRFNYFDSVIITSIQQLQRWKKATHLGNICKEVIKISDFVLVLIQYLSKRLLTFVQEGKVNSKLYRNTVAYIVNPEILCANKKSLTLRTRSSVWNLQKNVGNFTVLVCCATAN